MTFVRIARAVLVVGLVAICVWALVATSLWYSAQQENNDLVAANRRQRPTSDYIAAENQHQDCRKDREDKFLGAIGELLAPGTTPDQRAVAAASAHQYGQDLERIEDLCPTPTPPAFDNDGNLVRPYSVATTTTTTVPPPSG